jgi:hypothetical protein
VNCIRTADAMPATITIAATTTTLPPHTNQTRGRKPFQRDDSVLSFAKTPHNPDSLPRNNVTGGCACYSFQKDFEYWQGTAKITRDCHAVLAEGVSVFLLRLMCVLSVSLLFIPARGEAQVATERPELIAGPWEVASASGIDGIVFEILTSSSGPTGREQFDWQTMNIRVYHREGGKEAWGYFGTKDKASPQSYSMQDDHSFTLFDGERLRIHSIEVTGLKSFDLDIAFSPTSNEWSGTWSRSGQNSHVVLKRPEPNPGVTPTVFVGDWAGESAPNSPHYFAPGSLHIRESLDGVLSAWLDLTVSGMDPKTQSIHNDRRNGEWLDVNSVTDTGLILDTTNPMGPPSQFRGRLSEDHQVLTGTWERPGSGTLSAPDRFRRATAAAAQ